MRSICLHFQIHQPFRLRTYRFFDIGSSHEYYDDYQNRSITKRVAERCYLPMNRLLLGLIKEYGADFKVSFSISGVAIDHLRIYAPEVIESFKTLAKTGNVEFLAETYAHSLASLNDTEEFKDQVDKHVQLMEELFGKHPTAFRNTEMIYSDEIGKKVLEMGFHVMLTEGAKHILGWKSPNFLYCSAANPKLKLLLRNFQLSDDIGFRYSNQNWNEWPLTAEKFAKWINTYQNQNVVNIFIDYETFGEHQWKESGIFDFMKALPKQVFAKTDFKFSTPSEIAEINQTISAISVPEPISWADEERDLTAWLGNEMQDEAFDNLYNLNDKIQRCNDPDIMQDWLYLQTSDHFYYMCTKWFSDGTVHKYFNPYSSPYEAFINYMNILSDFTIRVEEYIQQNSEEVPEQKVEGKEYSLSEPQRETDFDLIFTLSKKELKKVLEKIDIKELAYSLYDKTEDILIDFKRKLPLAYKAQLEKLVSEIKRPRKTTIEGYRKKITSKLQSYFNLF